MSGDSCEHMLLKAETPSAALIIGKVNDLLDSAGVALDTRRKIDVAIDEIASNIIDYAYAGREGSFEFACSVADGKFTMQFKDDGVAFNPMEVKAPDLDGTSDGGGLGIYLTKALMDDVSYERIDSHNCLTITKLL